VPITYEDRGVSASKAGIRAIASALGGGLFPGAFCKAIPDVLTDGNEYCVLAHADGAGTKCALAYVYYREHQDVRVFRGIAHDCIAMNVDDLLCVGATGPFILSNSIGRNARIIPDIAVAEIIEGYREGVRHLANHGVALIDCGGETADVGDLVRTLVADATVFTRMPRASFIDCSRVTPGHVIVGLASFGLASYEERENSGIGSNGLTAARHDVLSAYVKEAYPESFAPEIANVAYLGRYALDDPVPNSTLTVGQALLSPTRTYAPVMVKVLNAVRGGISGIFHNTGGGLTKCLPFGDRVRYEKVELFETPPIFALIRGASGLSLREMVRTFNMGHLMEIVCERSAGEVVIEIAREFGIEAKIIGRVTRSPKGNCVVVAHRSESAEFWSGL
jgi:phosphoribosylformylglycinamidine cyclo-ligase